VRVTSAPEGASLTATISTVDTTLTASAPPLAVPSPSVRFQVMPRWAVEGLIRLLFA